MCPASVGEHAPRRSVKSAKERRCTVRVPASTSNLGAGFDCIGLAVDLWLNATAMLTGDGTDAPAVVRAGTLAQVVCPATEDLLWRGFVAACSFAGCDAPRGVAFDACSTIPVARGLGSSAAAVVAGVVLANDLLDLGFAEDELIDIATGVEGHPDNVAPSIRGGTVLCVRESDCAYHVAPLRVHASLRFVFAIPDFEFRTSIARAALPSTLPFATAVDAAARSAALVIGLTNADPRLLRAGLSDVLHVPFRREHVTGYDAVTDAACAAGAIGATLSGSGSTIVAVTTDAVADLVALQMITAWRAFGVRVETLTSSADVGGMQIVSGFASALEPHT